MAEDGLSAQPKTAFIVACLLVSLIGSFENKLQYNDKGTVTWPQELQGVMVDIEQAKQACRDWEQRGQRRGKYAPRRESVYKKNFVVEAIEKIDFDQLDKEPLFYIKWEGYHYECNTWEPMEHLTGADKILDEFLSSVFNESCLSELCQKFEVDVESVTDKVLKSSIADVDEIPSKLEAMKQLLSFYYLPVQSHFTKRLLDGQRALLNYYLSVRRDEQLLRIRRWEDIINRMDKSEAVIKVENNVDLEFPPENFCYINDYVPTGSIEIPDEPETHCECVDCGPFIKQCCGKQTHNAFTYTLKGKVNVNPGTAIFECNKRCKCGMNCRNRVVQHGRKVPLCIFRTSNGCGWGVKVLKRIWCGEFICEYVGEVIDHEEAERRGQLYNAEGRTYLFDLDYNSKDNLYTVDAATYGNVSHFINHSCDPNLGVYATWINCLDPNLPKLALFALREIQKGEELTFDYMMNIDTPVEPKTPEKGRVKLDTPEKGALSDRPTCKCEAESCRRYLF